MFASLVGSMDSLNLLIQRGADLSKRDDSSLCSFDKIVGADNAELLSCVYAYSKSVKRDSKDPTTIGMMHMAAAGEGTDCLEYLLNQGDYPNQLTNDVDRSMPLHFAVLHNNVEAVKLLLKHRGNPNALDEEKNSPLHYSIIVNNLEIVRLLDEHGGDATIKNELGQSPIDVSLHKKFKKIKLYFLSQ